MLCWVAAVIKKRKFVKRCIWTLSNCIEINKIRSWIHQLKYHKSNSIEYKSSPRLPLFGVPAMWMSLVTILIDSFLLPSFWSSPRSASKVMGIYWVWNFTILIFLKIIFTTFLVHVKFQKEFGFKFGMGYWLHCFHFQFNYFLWLDELKSFMTTHRPANQTTWSEEWFVNLVSN